MTDLVIHLTDLHFGKITPTFNLDTARKRVEQIPEMIAGEAGADFDKTTILMGGDCVDGTEIYPAQVATNSDSTVRQVAVAGEAVFQMAIKLNELTEAPVDIVGVLGNHGRAGKTSHPDSNFDAHLIYDLVLRAHYSEVDWLFVRNSCKTHEIVNVCGTKGLLAHAVAKHTGTPAMQVKILATVLEYDVDWIAAGHYHVPGHTVVEGRDYFAGGSLSGPDLMGQKISRYEPAAQTYWKVDEGRGAHGFGILRW